MCQPPPSQADAVTSSSGEQEGDEAASSSQPSGEKGRGGGEAKKKPTPGDASSSSAAAAAAAAPPPLSTAEEAELSARLVKVYQQLEAIDAFGAESRAAVILAGLSFDADMMRRATKTFSGGWRMRVGEEPRGGVKG